MHILALLKNPWAHKKKRKKSMIFEGIAERCRQMFKQAAYPGRHCCPSNKILSVSLKSVAGTII